MGIYQILQLKLPQVDAVQIGILLIVLVTVRLFLR